MNENFIKFSKNNWSNYTFIFPCVSVGNIGQLATDLLISTIPNLRKAGYLINNRLVQPIIGYDPYNQDSNELCLSVECNSKSFFIISNYLVLFLLIVYESIELSLVIMQQRAPLYKGKRNEFVKLLVEFIKSENFKEVICLTSSYAYERLDSQLYGFVVFFVFTISFI
jgi:proteasome assembly chaperone 2